MGIKGCGFMNKEKIIMVMIYVMSIVFCACGVNSSQENNNDFNADSQTIYNGDSDTKVDKNSLLFDDIIQVDIESFDIVCMDDVDIKEHAQDMKKLGYNMSYVLAKVINSAYYITEDNNGARVYEMEIMDVSHSYNDANLNKGDRIKCVVLGGNYNVKVGEEFMGRGTQIVLRNEQDISKIINKNEETYQIGNKVYYNLLLTKDFQYVIQTDSDGDIFLKNDEIYAMDVKKLIGDEWMTQDFWSYEYCCPLNHKEDKLYKQGAVTDDSFEVYGGEKILQLINGEKE